MPIYDFSDRFIYVLHVQNHWVTLTNIKPNSDIRSWLIYDSLNDSTHLELLKPVFRKIFCEKNSIEIETVKVQSQFGFDDCGLFALAYVCSILFKNDPACIFYEQIAMRHYFNRCIRSKRFLDFPNAKLAIEPVYTKHVIYLFI